MTDRQRQSTATPRKPGFGRRLLNAFLKGADESLAQARAEADEQADDDNQCLLRPDYSLQTRGYRKIG